MKLEVGKYYRNRAGKIKKITANLGGRFLDREGRFYMKHGMLGFLECEEDLMHEVPMIVAVSEENNVNLYAPLQVAYIGKWVDCAIGKIFSERIGIYFIDKAQELHWWITKDCISHLRNTPSITVDFSKSSYDQWYRILWQKLFDLYRENGGSLDCMNDLLIDLKSCDQLCKRVLGGATPTFFFSFSSGSDMTFWSSDNSHMDCDFTFKVEVSKDRATFEEV